MATGYLAQDPKKGLKINARIGFADESAFSDKPVVRKTWAPKGKTPILKVPGGWITRSVISLITCSPRGQRPRLGFAIVRGSVNAAAFVRFLKSIQRRQRGRKLILIIDNLRVHKAKAVKAYLAVQRHWLTVAHLPPYAPELNPAEYLWSSRKRRDFSNARIPDGCRLNRRIRASGRIAQKNASLLKGFLRASTLFQ